MSRTALPFLLLFTLLGGCSNTPSAVAWSSSGNFAAIPGTFVCMFDDGLASVGAYQDNFDREVASGPTGRWTEEGELSFKLQGTWEEIDGVLHVDFNPCDGPGCINRLVPDPTLDCSAIHPE